MLKGIVFDLAPEVAESQAVRELGDELELSGIDYILFAGISSSSVCDDRFPKPGLSSLVANSETSFATLLNPLVLPPEACLVITDSATGIFSAKAAGVTCVGYAPPGGCEDMSGAFALFEDFTSIDVAYLCRTHAHAMSYPAEILSTERLTVREFCKEDFPALYAMCTKPSTASFMEETLSDYDTEKEKHGAYLHNVYPFFDLALWGVYEKTSGKLIGRAGFSLPKEDNHTFSLGYLIDVPYRRRGYAKELIPALLSYAKEQGYPEISARIKKENHVSIKVLEQCEFPYECKKDEMKGIVTYTICLTKKERCLGK